jgi:hypothetical protein
LPELSVLQENEFYMEAFRPFSFEQFQISDSDYSSIQEFNSMEAIGMDENAERQILIDQFNVQVIDSAIKEDISAHFPVLAKDDPFADRVKRFNANMRQNLNLKSNISSADLQNSESSNLSGSSSQQFFKKVIRFDSITRKPVQPSANLSNLNQCFKFETIEESFPALEESMNDENFKEI